MRCSAKHNLEYKQTNKEKQSFSLVCQSIAGNILTFMKLLYYLKLALLCAKQKSASWILGQILQASIVSELAKLLCRWAKFHFANSLMVTKLTKFCTTFCLWERYFEREFRDFVCGSEISIKISFTISFAEITQGSQNEECGLRKGTANWWQSMLRQIVIQPFYQTFNKKQLL